MKCLATFGMHQRDYLTLAENAQVSCLSGRARETFQVRPCNLDVAKAGHSLRAQFEKSQAEPVFIPRSSLDVPAGFERLQQTMSSALVQLDGMAKLVKAPQGFVCRECIN